MVLSLPTGALLVEGGRLDKIAMMLLVAMPMAAVGAWILLGRRLDAPRSANSMLTATRSPSTLDRVPSGAAER
ncbi:hypothetical protein AB0D32_27595 [Micromonospora sp. NPDC048170]|uniref:hypothetical protein n=1 Tax=Micromonospora sp. NPDC048170 TaxID=3154819 RepID=UPI0033EDE414